MERSTCEEFVALEAVLPEVSEFGRVDVLAHVHHDGAHYPIHGIRLGSERREDPALLVVGGIHGLELIGARVAIAYLSTVVAQARWDQLFQHSLERTRLLFIPIVNPVGVARGWRANANGVDLMRNAPGGYRGWRTPLVGGQRWSPRLPWYMGDPEHMEVESQALVEFVVDQIFPAKTAIVIDVHSGFGLRDRLWFPYARTRQPPSCVAELHGLKRLLDATLPNHVYRFEPQAKNYTAHGDLWDYVFDRHREVTPPEHVLLPLTLEMGSWLWVKKNPRQAFTRLGSFNPIMPHRVRRTLRRHLPLFDFLRRAVASPFAWVPRDDDARADAVRQGYRSFYGLDV